MKILKVIGVISSLASDLHAIISDLVDIKDSDKLSEEKEKKLIEDLDKLVEDVKAQIKAK